MAKAGTLSVKIVGDTAPFERSMKGLRSKVGGAAKAIGKAGALGFGLAGTAAVTGAFKVAEFGDEVAKSSQKAGLGVEQFQELRFAFGQGGVEAATFDTALQKFNKRLGESATTGGTADEAFERLGVNLRDADGNVRDAGGAMDEVLPKLAAISSDAERAAVAGDLFGQRAGPELAAALSDGVGGIDEAREKAQELGIVMSEEAAENAEEFTDKWDDIKQSALGLLRTGLTPVMGFMSDRLFPFLQQTAIPALRDVGDWFRDKIPPAIAKAQDVAEDLADKWEDVFPAIKEAVEDVWDVLKDTFDFLKDNKPILIGVATAIGVGLVAAFLSWAAAAASAAAATIAATAPVLAIGAAIAALTAGVIWAYQNWGVFRDAVDAVASFLTGTVWPAVKAGAKWLGDTLAPAIADVAGWFADTLVPAVADVVEWIADKLAPVVKRHVDFLTNTVIPTIGKVASWFTGTLVPAVSDVVTWIADRLGTVIRTNVDYFNNYVIPMIQSVAGWFNDTLVPAISGVVDWLGDMLTEAGEVVSGIKSVFDDAVSFFTGLPGRISDAASGAFDGISNAALSAFNAVVRFWNSTAGQISFELPSWVPGGIGGKGFSMPTFDQISMGGKGGGHPTAGLPALEDGGRVLKTGLAVVHRGERFSGTRNQHPIGDGREVVIPVMLDGREIARSEAFIDEFGQVQARRSLNSAGAA